MSNKNPFHDESMWKGASPIIFSRAKRLRENMTVTEIILWEELKKKKLLGYKFRRQHPISNYIVDFYCHKLKLVIEVDGGYHNHFKQRELDKKRTEIIEFQGLKVIRFTNEEIAENLSTVIKEIKSIAFQLNKKSEE